MWWLISVPSCLVSVEVSSDEGYDMFKCRSVFWRRWRYVQVSKCLLMKVTVCSSIEVSSDKGDNMFKCRSVFWWRWRYVQVSKCLLTKVTICSSVELSSDEGDDMFKRRSVFWRRWRYVQVSKCLLTKETSRLNPRRIVCIEYTILLTDSNSQTLVVNSDIHWLHNKGIKS